MLAGDVHEELNGNSGSYVRRITRTGLAGEEILAGRVKLVEERFRKIQGVYEVVVKPCQLRGFFLHNVIPTFFPISRGRSLAVRSSFSSRPLANVVKRAYFRSIRLYQIFPEFAPGSPIMVMGFYFR